MGLVRFSCTSLAENFNQLHCENELKSIGRETEGITINLITATNIVSIVEARKSIL